MFSLFEKVSSFVGTMTGFYSYGYRKKEPGVYINRAVAKSFGLCQGMMSEDTLCDFVMRSVGGVNGRKIRCGERLLFKKSDGSYVTVTYEPMTEGKRGYVHEHRVRTGIKGDAFTSLPNFSAISSDAERRAGDAFFAVSITPYATRGETFDYACIAEFFDALRKRIKGTSVYWIGNREYIVMISPDKAESFVSLCKEDVALDGRPVKLSISRVFLPPKDTSVDQAKKLGFCVAKLRSGMENGEYTFSSDDYKEYLSMPKGSAQKRAAEAAELTFLPVISVKTGRAQYFRAELNDKKLAVSCFYGENSAIFGNSVMKKLTEGLLSKGLPQLSYCVPVFGLDFDENALCELISAANGKIYLELNIRAQRYERAIIEAVRKIKKAGAIPAVFDAQMKACELSALQRMGFSVIRANNNNVLKDCADFCRMFRIDCAVYGVDTDDGFIAMRRVGADLCAGLSVSPYVDVPKDTAFAEPFVICEDEEKEEPIKADNEVFDLSRFTAEMLYLGFEEEINGLVAPKSCTPTEHLEELCGLERAKKGELVPCEYEEGIGAKKKRKKAKTDKAQKKRQKKEIKQGKLKKIKLEKKK